MVRKEMSRIEETSQGQKRLKKNVEKWTVVVLMFISLSINEQKFQLVCEISL